ncbi:MAG: helix-turn-helix transcriptional regulator [Lacrimispora sp.]
MTLGDIVRQYRKENKVSMDTFAQRSGLSKGYISMLENNINPRNNKPIAPTLPTIKKIAVGMNTDMDSLFKILDGRQKISLEDEKSYLDIGQRIREVKPPAQTQITQAEQTILYKYRSIDDKGKHTVNTVLEMEYNRCKGADMSKVTMISPKEDKSHLILDAAHQRTDLSKNELSDKARNKHDDDIMNDPNF